jgi:hypothetical protein
MLATVAARAVLGGQQRALGFQHRLEVDQAAAVALLGQQGCIACGIGSSLQPHQALTIAAQCHQGIFHILQRREHRSLIAHTGLLQSCLLHTHLGTRRATIHQRHRHTGQQGAGDGAPLVRAPTVRARRPRLPEMRKSGVARGIGLRHPRQRSGNALFG